MQHVLPNVRHILFSNAFSSLISLLPGMMLTSVEESGKHFPCTFVCTYYASLFMFCLCFCFVVLLLCLPEIHRPNVSNTVFSYVQAVHATIRPILDHADLIASRT